MRQFSASNLGHFYFGYLGHYHFGITLMNFLEEKGNLFQIHDYFKYFQMFLNYDVKKIAHDFLGAYYLKSKRPDIAAGHFINSKNYIELLKNADETIKKLKELGNFNRLENILINLIYFSLKGKDIAKTDKLLIDWGDFYSQTRGDAVKSLEAYAMCSEDNLEAKQGKAEQLRLLGEYKKSEELYKKVINKIENDNFKRGESINRLATLHVYQGEIKKAKQKLEELNELCKPSKIAEQKKLNKLSALRDKTQANINRYTMEYKKMMKIESNQFDDSVDQGSGNWSLANAYRLKGDYSKASEKYEEARRRYWRAKNHIGFAGWYWGNGINKLILEKDYILNGGNIKNIDGNEVNFEKYFENGLKYCHEDENVKKDIINRIGYIWLKQLAGEYYYLKNDFSNAAECYTDALKEAEKNGKGEIFSAKTISYLGLSEIYRKTGENGKANILKEDALEFFKKFGFKWEEIPKRIEQKNNLEDLHPFNFPY